VTVGGTSRPKSYRVRDGDQIEFEPPNRVAPLEPSRLALRIAYEDEHLLVVDKPANVVVHPGAGHVHGTLAAALAAAGAAGGEADRPGIVHRLDRDTSGLLVVARSVDAYERLRRIVRARALEREYLALVRGKPRSRTGRIEAPIGRDRNDPTRQSLDTDSPKDAVTHFELLELLPRHSLLRVRLVTGRMHQIRVHLAAIGLPVSGDPTYGIAGDLALERQFLHASRLAFDHPVTGAHIEVESPLPGDLTAALERARGRNGSSER
jgi:23S rRNA pseudouridine1911/1915/1917 synthase